MELPTYFFKYNCKYSKQPTLKEILHTTQLEYGKGGFLIDLIRHNPGSLNVEITQTIQNRKNETHSIRLNPPVIDALVKVLKMYQAQIPASTCSQKSYLSKEVQQEIQDRYLNDCVSIEDLSTQF